MKCRLPEYPVATTGLPRAIASAIVKTQPLAPVQRHVAVARAQQRILLLLGVVASTMRTSGRSLTAARSRSSSAEPLVAVDALDDEHRPFVGLERA